VNSETVAARHEKSVGKPALIGNCQAGWQVMMACAMRPDLPGPILLALAYISGLLLWLNPRRTSHLPGFAAIGQMALTNYVLQSIVLGCIFYGYGFGLFGRIGSAAAAGFGLAIYGAQLQLSRFWLRRFRFGPFEWLWRSLTYWKAQPMRRSLTNSFELRL
jgi:uncharacterized membrane protein YeiB